MLSRRQIEILLELCENPDTYMTAPYFAQKQQVSLRSIQGDVKAIKSELAQYPCVEFQSAPQKGSRVVVKDPERGHRLFRCGCQRLVCRRSSVLPGKRPDGRKERHKFCAI